MWLQGNIRFGLYVLVSGNFYHESIARRIHGMIYKVGLEEDVVLTGGCAQNKALQKALEERLNLTLANLGENPQIMGAMGAALFAYEHGHQQANA